MGQKWRELKDTSRNTQNKAQKAKRGGKYIKENERCIYVYIYMLSRVQLFATPWTVACQALLSMGFSRQPGMGCCFLLQGIFSTQGLNLYFPWRLQRQVDSLPLSLLGGLQKWLSCIVFEISKSKIERTGPDQYLNR